MTVLRLGYSDPKTGAFGAHPVLGGPLDLNDGQTWTLLGGPEWPVAGLRMPLPPRTIAHGGNVRTLGEIVTRATYRRNREVALRLALGPLASAQALSTALGTLARWLDATPEQAVCLEVRLPGATVPVWLDVVAAAHAAPEDEGQWLRGQLEPVEVRLLARPGLRGARQTLSNLVPNPGFEAPSGPGLLAFSDPLATAQAYALAAGGPLGQESTTYADAVQADAPLRYYRLGEAAGTVAADAAGAGVAGTLAGTVTLGVAGALVGDADTAMTFDGATGTIGAAGTGLPTGNAAITLECWLRYAAAPGAQVIALTAGNAGTLDQAVFLGLSASGQAQFAPALDVPLLVTSAAPLSTNAWHHLVGTWDGTTARLYVDGAAVGSATGGALALVANGVRIGSYTASSLFFAGSLDEVAIYASALSAARVSAHYAAGTAAPLAGAANTLRLPASTRARFGSPAWGALRTWETRLRLAPGATYRATLHRVDAQNLLAAEVTETDLTLAQTVAGVRTVLGTVSTRTVAGVWYWLRCTQFPHPPGQTASTPDLPDVQLVLLADAAGQAGAQRAQVGPLPLPSATAITGAAEVEAVGAAVGLSRNSVTLFGPGDWLVINEGAGVAAAAWEADAAQTYAAGPVASLGAARLDLPPAGAVDASWRLTTGTALDAALPIRTGGDALRVAAQVRSAGLSATAELALVLREYDGAGALLATTVAASALGNQATWTALVGRVVTQPGTVWADLALRTRDAVAGASANGKVWWEQVQAWNETATGQVAMPYCELRFGQSPAQLVLSGLVGQLAAPAHVSLGTKVASWGPGSVLRGMLGCARVASTTRRLVAASHGWYGTALAPQATPVLDAGSYGGYYVQAAVGSGGWQPRAFSLRADAGRGTYHLLQRFWSGQATANVANVGARLQEQERSQPWYGALDGSDVLAQVYGPWRYPLAAGSTWTVADVGQVALDPYGASALGDGSTRFLTPRAQWTDATAGGSTCRASWQALVPTDGRALLWQMNNPGNSVLTVVDRWVWAYSDGLLWARGQALGSAWWQYSLEGAPLAAPARAAGGAGTQSTGAVNVGGTGDAVAVVDPVGEPSGINTWVAYVSDDSGACLPIAAEVVYDPLYLYPVG